MPRIESIDVSIAELTQLVEAASSGAIPREGVRKLNAAVDTLGAIAEMLEQLDTTIERLRALLLAPRTSEKLRKVCEDVPPPQPASVPKTCRKGHGRRGAGAYT
jgi:hypothetical protein